MLTADKPLFAADVIYHYTTWDTGSGISVTAAAWNDPIENFGLAVNRFTSDPSTEIRTQFAGWHAVTQLIPLSALNLPVIPGVSVENSFALGIDEGNFLVDVQVTH